MKYAEIGWFILGIVAMILSERRSLTAGPVASLYNGNLLNEKVWIEENGVAVIEVENAVGLTDSRTGWKVTTTPKGYTGSGYCVWTGPADWGPESRPYDTVLLTGRKLSFKVKNTTPGTYFAKVRNFHHKEDGDNDVWVSINKSHWGKTYDHQVEQFTFDERGTWATYELAPGIYDVELAGRSFGFGADRIVLFLSHLPEEKWSHHLLPESRIIVD